MLAANLLEAMLLVRGSVGGASVTGTLYERGEDPPSFKGAPDEDAPYVWVCDEFYAVESGGQTQSVAGREIQVAFDTPMPKGFDTRSQALEAAEEHIRTQFARLGVDAADVEIEIVREYEQEV